MNKHLLKTRYDLFTHPNIELISMLVAVNKADGPVLFRSATAASEGKGRGRKRSVVGRKEKKAKARRRGKRWMPPKKQDKPRKNLASEKTRGDGGGAGEKEKARRMPGGQREEGNRGGKLARAMGRRGRGKRDDKGGWSSKGNDAHENYVLQRKLIAFCHF